MSTRGCYRFTDMYNTLTVYKHCDNYPYTKEGGVAAIAAALPYAWPLPRFEADEFAAAFVSAAKVKLTEGVVRWGPQAAGGGVRLLNTPDPITLTHMPSDIEFLYDVTERNGVIWVKVSDIEHSDGWSSINAKIMAEGPLAGMLDRFKEWPADDEYAS